MHRWDVASVREAGEEQPLLKAASSGAGVLQQRRPESLGTLSRTCTPMPKPAVAAMAVPIAAA